MRIFAPIGVAQRWQFSAARQRQEEELIAASASEETLAIWEEKLVGVSETMRKTHADWTARLAQRDAASEASRKAASDEHERLLAVHAAAHEEALREAAARAAAAATASKQAHAADRAELVAEHEALVDKWESKLAGVWEAMATIHGEWEARLSEAEAEKQSYAAAAVEAAHRDHQLAMVTQAKRHQDALLALQHNLVGEFVPSTLLVMPHRPPRGQSADGRPRRTDRKWKLQAEAEDLIPRSADLGLSSVSSHSDGTLDSEVAMVTAQHEVTRNIGKSPPPSDLTHVRSHVIEVPHGTESCEMLAEIHM
eukprot:SAG11_NODE_3555_length_2375_cov_1.669156_1_plen_310_part_00